MTKHQADAVSGGVLLIGLGLCFYFGFWPTILFVLGAAAIVEGLVEGRGWYAFQGSLWMVGLGVWALFGFSLVALFVVLGLSMIVGAFVKPPFLQPKPKPFVDNTLE